MDKTAGMGDGVFVVTITDAFGDMTVSCFPKEKAMAGVVLGRHRTSDIRVDDIMISNRHGLIKATYKEHTLDQIFVTDTSSNGIEYNNHEIGRNNTTNISPSEKLVINLGPKRTYFVTFSQTAVTAPSTLIVKDLEPTIYQRFDILRRLGDGQYSRVYQAQDRQTGEVIALKLLHQSKNDFLGGDRVKNELELMRKVAHPNVVRFNEAIFTDSRVLFSLELCNGGDLFTLIIDNGAMKEAEACFVWYQLLDAVNYLHSLNIIHRDLKTENIFLVERCPYPEIKVGDFGMAKPTTTGTTACGTLNYAAPEVICQQGRPYTRACDVWSIGIILYILLSGSHPFEMNDDAKMNQQIRAGEFDFSQTCWDLVTTEPKELIRKMIVVDPEQRESIPALMASAWVAKNRHFFPKIRSEQQHALGASADEPPLKKPLAPPEEAMP